MGFFSTSFKIAKHNSLTDKLEKKKKKKAERKAPITSLAFYFFFNLYYIQLVKKITFVEKEINYDHWTKFKNKNKSDIIIIK